MRRLPFLNWKARIYRNLWLQAVHESSHSAFPEERYRGRGIVYSSGGGHHFVNLWVNLCLLRRELKCTLPVEVWHFGSRELIPSLAELLEPLDVRIMDGELKACDLPKGRDRGYALKTLAIEHSTFEEILYLDVDSYPVIDPSVLFQEPSYQWSGSWFWTDIWRSDTETFLWDLWDLPFVDEPDWESGQMLLDKRRCWKALMLVRHMNRHFNFYYRHMYGDKMTFHAAWNRLDLPYAMSSFPASLVSSIKGRKLLNHYDMQGEMLFQHRVMSDWNVLEPEHQDNFLLNFKFHDQCLVYLDELKGKWPPDANTCRAATFGGTTAAWVDFIGQAWKAIAQQRIIGSSQTPGEACDNTWEELACQVWKSPYIAEPKLMAMALETLRIRPERQLEDLTRFIAVLIFVDPRLWEMIPQDPIADGTGAKALWGKLKDLVTDISDLRHGPGCLFVRGRMPSTGTNGLPMGSEKILAEALAGLMGEEWPHFSACSGLRMIRPGDGNHGLPAGQWIVSERGNKVLVLTPIKNAVLQAGHYIDRLLRLSYPPELLSLGMLESDSHDGSYEIYQRDLGRLQDSWCRTRIWKHDFRFKIPEGLTRWHPSIQLERRIVLAKSRNLLLKNALQDEDWVLWLDSDVIDYPPDIIQQLMSYGKNILHPHCMTEYGGGTFDRNGWRDERRIFLQDLRAREILAPLEAVGGTMLLIKADLHRQGLIFPETPYCRPSREIPKSGPPWCADTPGEVETEGLGLLASEMGYTCWGLPELEILHGKR